jgi:hypothetical protein
MEMEITEKTNIVPHKITTDLDEYPTLSSRPCELCGRKYVLEYMTCDLICERCYKKHGCWNKRDGGCFTNKMAKLCRY